MKIGDIKLRSAAKSKINPEPVNRKSRISSGINEQALEDKIRIKAYELYENRGYQNGHDLADWLEAKRIVESEINL